MNYEYTWDDEGNRLIVVSTIWLGKDRRRTLKKITAAAALRAEEWEVLRRIQRERDPK
jgi:hypothetical protein